MESSFKVKRVMTDMEVKLQKKLLGRSTNIVTQSGHKGTRPSNIFGLYLQEFSDLVSENLKFYFECSRMGVNFFKALLFEDISQKDLHIGALIQSRKLPVLRKLRHTNIEDMIVCNWKEGKDFLVENFKKKNLMFINFIADIIDAQLSGVAIFEKKFTPENGRVWLSQIPKIPAHLYVYDDKENKYTFVAPQDNDVMKMRAIGAQFQTEIDISKISSIELADIKKIEVHGFDGSNPNGFENGVVRSIIWGYFFKSFTLKDWAIFLELYAIPARVGKYDAYSGMSQPELDMFTEMVENFGSAMWAVINKENSIELLEHNKTATSDVFEKFIEYWDTKTSIRILGQNLTTQVIKEGTRAASEIHYQVKEEIVDADTTLVENTINELMADILKLNFANIPEYPQFRFPLTKSVQEQKERSGIYVDLKTLGYRPTKENLEAEFGVELEEVSEDIREPRSDYTDRLLTEIYFSEFNRINNA